MGPVSILVSASIHHVIDHSRGRRGQTVIYSVEHATAKTRR